MLKATIASTPTELEMAFSLRYAQYRQLGTIPEISSNQLYDDFDFVPHARILVVKNPLGDIVATARLLRSGGMHERLTADELFAEERCALPHDSDRPLYETTRLAIANQYRSNPEPFFRLFGLAAHLALDENPSFAIAPARERQALSYMRLLGMTDLAPERYSPAQQVSLRFLGAPYEHAFSCLTRRYRTCFPDAARRSEKGEVPSSSVIS